MGTGQSRGAGTNSLSVPKDRSPAVPRGRAPTPELTGVGSAPQPGSPAAPAAPPALPRGRPVPLCPIRYRSDPGRAVSGAHLGAAGPCRAVPCSAGAERGRAGAAEAGRGGTGWDGAGGRAVRGSPRAGTGTPTPGVLVGTRSPGGTGGATRSRGSQRVTGHHGGQVWVGTIPQRDTGENRGPWCRAGTLPRRPSAASARLSEGPCAWEVAASIPGFMQGPGTLAPVGPSATGSRGCRHPGI